MLDISSRPDGAEKAGLDRRQLLKIGAWAAPALVVAAAVPAASASDPIPVPEAVIRWDTPPAGWRVWENPVGYVIQFQIENVYTADLATVSGLTVSISIPEAYLGAQAPTIGPGTAQPALWSVTSVGAPQNGTRVVTLAYSGTLAPAQDTGNTVLHVQLPAVPATGFTFSASAWASNSNVLADSGNVT